MIRKTGLSSIIGYGRSSMLKDDIKTIGDAVQKIGILLSKKAVIESIIKYIEQFVQTDTFFPDKGIKSPGAGGEIVAQDILIEVLSEHQMKLEGLDKEINSIRKESVGRADVKKLKRTSREIPKRRKNGKPKKSSK